MLPPNPRNALHAFQVALQALVVRHGAMVGAVQEEGLVVSIPHAEAARMESALGAKFHFQVDHFGNITASVTGYSGERAPRLHPADRDNPPPAAED